MSKHRLIYHANSASTHLLHHSLCSLVCVQVFYIFCVRERARERERVCVFVYVPTCHLMICKVHKSAQSTDFMYMFLLQCLEEIHKLWIIWEVSIMCEEYMRVRVLMSSTTHEQKHIKHKHTHIPTHKHKLRLKSQTTNTHTFTQHKPDCTPRVFFFCFD